MVKILLGQEEINPDNPDNNGWKPLLYAALNGHEGVVKILLGRQELNPDKPDNHGQIALMYPARCATQRVIELLKPHGAATLERLEA